MNLNSIQKEGNGEGRNRVWSFTKFVILREI